MAGESKQNGAGQWTIETLRAHFTALLESQREAVDRAFADNKERVDTALQSSNKRLDGMNEFRATLESQQRTFIPRSELDLIVRAYTDRLTTIERTQVQSGGRYDGIGWIIGIIGGVVGIVGTVATIFMATKHG